MHLHTLSLPGARPIWEVRGRDSAGVSVLVRDHGLALDDPSIAQMLAARGSDPPFRSKAVRTAEGHLSFVYKAAAEIGELGDNTAAMRVEDRKSTRLNSSH